MEVFLSARTALLIPGDFVDSFREKDAWIAMRLRPEPNVTVEGPSQAIAIDPRGYFLTADHCLNHPKLTIVFRTAGGLRVTSPRVIARLHDQDIAIVGVDSSLPKTFEWAYTRSFKAGDALLSIGTGDPGVEGNTLFFQRHCIAGVVKELASMSGDAESVRHTLPLRPEKAVVRRLISRVDSSQ